MRKRCKEKREGKTLPGRAERKSMREYEVNEKGHLVFGGCDTVRLAEKYATPVYVMDEGLIRRRLEEIRTVFLQPYPNARAVYASKAFQTKEMCRLVTEGGLGLDVVSGGEIYAALAAGVDPSCMVFHGNNKTPEEIRMAAEAGVGRFIVDNAYELELLEKQAGRGKAPIRVLLRITPGVDSHTHKFISTGNIDSKFGISLEKEERDRIIKRVMDMEGVELMGFHFHVGSQLHENDSHLAALDILLGLVDEVKESLGFEARELNLGGGFGIYYAKGDQTARLKDFVDPMMEKINRFYHERSLPLPLVFIEPGRWICGEAGITLYTVGSVKNIPGIKTYVAVDGGMPDNPRPILYQAKYEAVLANKAAAPKKQIVSVAGKCCESGDILIEDLPVGPVESGDILAVFSTGAYHHSMASNYNRLLRPPVVMVDEGKDHLSVRRETYEDLIAREL